MGMYNQQTNCRYYGSMIGCKNGNQCRFNHSNPNSVPFCRFPNNCSYGNNCRFRHMDFYQNTQINNSSLTLMHQPQWQYMQQPITQNRTQFKQKRALSNKQRKWLLIYGYIRQNCKNNDIPNDISLLISKWYITAFCIYIKGDLMQGLLKTGLHCKDEIILNGDISLRLSFIPRSFATVAMKLSVSESTKSEIYWVHTYYECGFENIPNTITKNRIKSRRQDPLIHFLAPYSLLESKRELCFYIDIELLGYSLVNEGKFIPNPNIKSPAWKSYWIYDWILEDKVLYNFLNTVKSQTVFSPNFMDDCMGIMIEPKCKDRPTICIKLYKFPYGLKKLCMNFSLNINNWIYNNCWMPSITGGSYGFIIPPVSIPITIWNDIKDKLIISVTIHIKTVSW